RKSGEARSDVFSVVRPLALALVASAIFAGLTVLARPGGRLLHHFGQQGRMVIKERFIQRLRDPSRWYAVPPGLGGGGLAARVPVKARREPGRRLFLCLLVAWVVVTVLTSAAQVLDLPVAGGRLLNYLFAIPLLAGVFFWALTRALSWRWGQTGMLLGALIAVGTAVGFGSVAWQWQIDRPPSIGPAAVRQAAAAGQYASATHPEGEVIFVQEARRHTWEELQASLPPDVVPRVKQFSGAPSDVESHTFESRSGPSGGEQLAFVLRAYNRAGYRDALGSGHWSQVAPGVLVRAATISAAPVAAAPPRGNFGVWALTWIVAAVALLLAGVGSGWAAALLPSDPLVRVSLSPALGAST